MGLRPDELISSVARYLELKVKLIAAKTQLNLRRLITAAVLWGVIAVMVLVGVVISSIALGVWIGVSLGTWYFGLLLVGVSYSLVALILYFFRRPLFRKILSVVNIFIQRATSSEDSAL